MEDYDRAEAELKVLIDNAQSPQTKVVGYLVLSRLYFYLGHYRAALKMTDELLELARKLEDVAGEARMNIRKGLIGFWGWNDVEGAKREIERARRHSKKINSLYFWIDYFYLSLFAGKFNLAEEAIWTRFDTKVRVLTMRNNLDRRRYYPFPKAELLSARGECGKAAALVDSVYQFTTAFGRVAMLYHLAECQFEQGYLEEAEKRIRKFQTIYNAAFDYRAIYYPRSFYLLGKIYEGKGDAKLAIENYEKLLNLWKDADQDLTVLIDTKARLANLRGSQNIQ